jgi:hypothetical protein
MCILLKGQCQEIFDYFVFFIGGKLTTGVIDTGGYTGGHIFPEIYFDCDTGGQFAMISTMPA